ncbi:hypothetical protein Hanom_Chr15g01360741 [Helianthus anomalus]
MLGGILRRGGLIVGGLFIFRDKGKIYPHFILPDYTLRVGFYWIHLFVCLFYIIINAMVYGR